MTSAQRYQATQSGAGWNVVDIFTGLLAEVGDGVFHGLDRESASQYTVILNELDRRRRGVRDRF